MKGSWPTDLANPTTAPVLSPVPRVVAIALTSLCQLRCTHCFNNSGPENARQIEFEMIERILDEVASWQVSRIRLSGGEPTLYSRFDDVVRACQRRGISVVLNTNGQYSRSMLDYLRGAPIELFIVSVDGLAEGNDAIRGPGSFARAIQACQTLIESGQKLMLCCHVTAATVRDVGGLIDLAARLGCDFKVSPVRPIGRARTSMEGPIVTPAQYVQVVKTVVERRRSTHTIRLFTDFDILEPLEGGHECVRDPARASCKAGRTMVNIDFDGRIYPCAFLATPAGEFSAGTIYEGTIESAWRSAAAFEPLRVHTKSSECKSCLHYQARCVGGCPAISHFTYGVLDALDPTCFASLIPGGEPDGIG